MVFLFILSSTAILWLFVFIVVKYIVVSFISSSFALLGIRHQNSLTSVPSTNPSSTFWACQHFFPMVGNLLFVLEFYYVAYILGIPSIWSYNSLSLLLYLATFNSCERMSLHILLSNIQHLTLLKNLMSKLQ